MAELLEVWLDVDLNKTDLSVDDYIYIYIYIYDDFNLNTWN